MRMIFSVWISIISGSSSLVLWFINESVRLVLASSLLFCSSRILYSNCLVSLSLKSITELNKHIVDGEYYTISQFATTKIIDVSDSGYLLFDEGLSGDGDKISYETNTLQPFASLTEKV